MSGVALETINLSPQDEVRERKVIVNELVIMYSMVNVNVV